MLNTSYVKHFVGYTKKGSRVNGSTGHNEIFLSFILTGVNRPQTGPSLPCVWLVDICWVKKIAGLSQQVCDEQRTLVSVLQGRGCKP